MEEHHPVQVHSGIVGGRYQVAFDEGVPKLCPVIEKLEQRGSAKSLTVRKYERLGLFILVAIPLPGTGAWTGALVAALLRIRMQVALPAIFLGVLIAGVLVTAVSCGVISLWE